MPHHRWALVTYSRCGSRGLEKCSSDACTREAVRNTDACFDEKPADIDEVVVYSRDSAEISLQAWLIHAAQSLINS